MSRRDSRPACLEFYGHGARSNRDGVEFVDRVTPPDATRTIVRSLGDVNSQSSETTSESVPYGSARDLPSFREIAEQVRGFGLLTRFIFRPLRPQILEAERELERLAGVVDGFYNRLGERNWIFHDALPVDEIEQLLAEADNPESAEQRLIELYRGDAFIKRRILRLNPHEGMRARRRQIDRALKHYGAGEFDSCALQLIAVMDGFVNDFDAERRKGLHAREPEEMTAWDSVVGHHLGLTHAMETFGKTIKKRIDDEVVELHRNGIMHGTVVNFDNEVVATKAWNMLFAVADWATAVTKAAEPQEPKPSIREAFASIKKNADARRRDETFVPWTVQSSDAGFPDDPVVQRASGFLEAWERGQWGIVTEFMPPVLRERCSRGEAITQTKWTFEWHEIANWSLDSVTYVLPGVAEVQGSAIVDGEQRDMQFRMIHLTADGDRTVPEHADAPWHAAIWLPKTYFEQRTASA